MQNNTHSGRDREQASCELTMKLEHRKQCLKVLGVVKLTIGNQATSWSYRVQANCERTMKLERSNVARIDGEILPVWNQSRGVFPRVGIGITRLSSAGVVTLRVSWAWTHVSQKGLFLQAASSGSKPISVLISADRFPVRRRQRNRTTNNAGVREKIKYMQLKVSVISDRPDEYVGKRAWSKAKS